MMDHGINYNIKYQLQKRVNRYLDISKIKITGRTTKKLRTAKFHVDGGIIACCLIITYWGVKSH